MSYPPQHPEPNHTSGLNEDAFAVQPGQPITFSTGQFAGQTMRVELLEVQKADSGRKYAKVDRRPLDPPPAIMLRLYFVGNTGDRQWEREVDNYDEIRNIGMLCGVDLFPVPDKILDENIPVPRSTMASNIPDFVAYTPSQASSSSASSPGMRNVSPRALRVSSDQVSAPFELQTSGNLRLNYPGSTQLTESAYTYFPLHPFTTPSADGVGAPRTIPFQIPRRQPMLGQLNEAQPPRDVVLRIGNHLVTESSNLTPALVGEKFVEPVLIDYKGKKCFFFVFGDLAVQREGTFIFRYRAFDIFSSVPESPGHPILAELYGGPFRVYSTREFPGLAPSTELTRIFSQCGVRVTLRDAERSRRGPSRSEVADVSKLLWYLSLTNKATCVPGSALAPALSEGEKTTIRIMPLPEHAIPVVLGKVDGSMVGKKVRLVGRMLWYDPVSALIALVDGDRAVLVDVSLCVSPRSAAWVQEYLCQLVVVGYIELNEDALGMKLASEHKASLVVNCQIVLRAILVVPDDSLNIAEYNAFLEEEGEI